MTVWVLILRYVVLLADVEIIAQHHAFLFPSKAVCEDARLVVERSTAAMAPQGFTQIPMPQLTGCLEQSIMTVNELTDYVATFR